MDAAPLLTRTAPAIAADDRGGLPTLRVLASSAGWCSEIFDRGRRSRPNADLCRVPAHGSRRPRRRGDCGVLRARVTGTGTEGVEQVFAVASFATVHDGLITELTEVWTDVDLAAPDGTRPLA